MNEIVVRTNSLLELLVQEAEYLWGAGWIKISVYKWLDIDGRELIQGDAVIEQRRRDLAGSIA